MAHEQSGSQDVVSMAQSFGSSHLPLRRLPGLYFSPDEPSSGEVDEGGGGDDLAAQIESLKAENTRYREQLSGARQFMTAAQEKGLRSRDDLANYDPEGVAKYQDFMKRSQGRVDLDSLLNLVGNDEDEKASPSVDVDAIRKELLEQARGEVKSEFSRNRAEDAHNAREQEIKSKVDAYLGELGVSESRMKFERGAILSELQNAMQLYDEGHPLRESHLQPANDEAIAKVLEEYKAAYAEERGRQIQKKADDAKRGGTSTPAGNNAASDDDNNDNESEGKPRIGSKEQRKRVEEHYERIKARRSGGSVSSLG